jgi:hypothetical protein
MPETFSTVSAEEPLSTETVDLLLGEALAQAHLALYRGYLHEVNNTLAGVGTLAEAMMGSPSDTVEANLELISSTMTRAISLEKRVRAVVNQPTSPIKMNAGEFAEGYRDLWELMLPRTVRLAWQSASAPMDVSPKSLVEVLLVAFTLARASSAATFSVTWSPSLTFDFGPLSPSADAHLASRLERALGILAQRAGFVWTQHARLVELSHAPLSV